MNSSSASVSTADSLQTAFNFVYPTATSRIADPRKRAEAYDLEGQVMFQEGHYQEALQKFQDALRVRQSLNLSSTNNLDLAVSYRNIGATYYRLNDFVQALSYHEKALQIREQALGRNNLLTSDSYENMGVVYRSQGRSSEALRYLNTALEIRKRLEQQVSQADPVNLKLKIATSLYDLGTVYYDMGNMSKAFECHQEAFKIRSQYLRDSNNPEMIESELATRQVQLVLFPG
jgi:tetratricopeptide (TPR) repeat protein